MPQVWTIALQTDYTVCFPLLHDIYPSVADFYALSLHSKVLSVIESVFMQLVYEPVILMFNL